MVSPEGEALFGRNFDWNTCQFMVVAAYPERGNASLSTVNLDFITQNGKEGAVEMALRMNRVKTLAALYAPLDGMNEKGLAVSVNMIQDSVSISHHHHGGAAIVGPGCRCGSSTGKPCYFLYDEAAWHTMLLGIIRGALWGMGMPQILKLLLGRHRVMYIAAANGRYGGAMR